ncbi:hypothetical protein An03g01100 [Aspergillus niger]|uniref:Uncharacterized protein n=2 Tax=Aspergillus niger TaxID=5061 RepID=A2QFX3_ASPNC|nr:hypothetical protein An03g01100 [Aspergillus niger]CAK38083.1 hypothetical protein An03g01100 [Aspergillus niger]
MVRAIVMFFGCCADIQYGISVLSSEGVRPAWLHYGPQRSLSLHLSTTSSLVALLSPSRKMGPGIRLPCGINTGEDLSLLLSRKCKFAGGTELFRADSSSRHYWIVLREEKHRIISRDHDPGSTAWHDQQKKKGVPSQARLVPRPQYRPVLFSLLSLKVASLILPVLDTHPTTVSDVRRIQPRMVFPIGESLLSLFVPLDLSCTDTTLLNGKLTQGKRWNIPAMRQRIRIRVLCSNGCCGCLGAGLSGALHTAAISKGPVIAAFWS